MHILKTILKSHRTLLLIILSSALFLRVHTLDYPNTYVFDEVYHAFTAKEYLKQSLPAWEWWNTPPKGVAYEWTHPPLAKEIMAASMFFLQTEAPWAWRLPGVLLGTLSVFIIYKIGEHLFKDKYAGIFAAFVFSIDGINFVQSRTGMNDIYFVTFSLITLLAYLKNKFFLASVFLGLALSSKWAAIYLVGILGILILKNRAYAKIPLFLVIPPIIYAISYIPFFALGHTPEQFVELHRQMWWYHTNLKATHDYASPWWSWTLNLYPVWYYVEYYKNRLISNIFLSGNPFVLWLGLFTVILSLGEFIKKRSFGLGVALLGYAAFLLPWALSPRIMFLYHYSPSVAFMSLVLGYQLSKLIHLKRGRILLAILLLLFTVSFSAIYPFLTGVPLYRSTIELFFDTNATKNPFH